MPLSDLPMSVLFVIFLLGFLLLGIYPAWKRTAEKARRLLEKHSGSLEPLTELFDPAPPTEKPLKPLRQEIDDFENLLLWRLSQPPIKGLSRKQLRESLHLESSALRAALESLSRKGLVHIRISPLFGFRFSLSETGYAYAVEQGYITQLLNNQSS